MDICKLCNSEFKNLNTHLRGKHKMSREDYNLQFSEEDTEFKEINEDDILPKEDGVITYKERIEGIFDGPKQTNAEMILGDYLKLKGLTLSELNHIVTQFKGGSGIPISQRLKRDQDIGKERASKLKDESRVETDDVLTAEWLRKDYGFKWIETRSARGTTPKTWVLEK